MIAGGLRRWRAAAWRVVSVMVVGALASAPAAVPAAVVAQSAAPRLSPLVAALAAEQPEAMLDVIVRKAAPGDAVEAWVTQHGGAVTADLHLLNAFAARLPAALAASLADQPTVQQVALDAPVRAVDADPLVGLLREDFTIGVIAETGSGVWSSGWDWAGTAWLELGEQDGPIAGAIAVTSFMSGDAQGLRLQAAERGLQGSADLSGATAAQLSLTYRRKDLASETDFVRVEVSADGGQTWAELGRLGGPATDAQLQQAAYDLAGFLTPGFALRLVTSGTWSPDARVYIDTIVIDYAPRLEAAAGEHVETLNNTLWLPLVRASGEAATATDSLDSAAAMVLPNTLSDNFWWVSYGNNAGTHPWKSNWIESDVAGAGPLAGNVDLFAGELWLTDNPDTGTQPSIRRAANLSGAVEAVFSFNFRTTSGVDADDVVVVEISADGGQTYQVLEVFQGLKGARRGKRTFPITAYATANTSIRFRVAANYGQAAESFVVDDVTLDYWLTCRKCVDKSRLTNAYVYAVGADRVWNEPPYRQGEAVTVAVLDSGVAEHLDLQGDSWSGRVLEHVDFTGAWFPDDLNGHGSHVAGIMAGDGYASDGAFIGLAPRLQLVDVRVTDDFGRGSTSGVVAGLQWVYDHKDVYNIRVVNLSLNSAAAGSYHDNPLNAAAEILWFNGIVVVASAGNNGGGNQIYAPANDPFLITVGAADDRGTATLTDDRVASFSAYGTTSDGFAKPDLVAPGKDIVSLLSSDDSNLAREHPANKLLTWAGNAYFRMSGTSVAAPMVAAAAALILETEPYLTPDQVKYRLLATANQTWPNYDPTEAGAGYLDIYAAVHGSTTASANTGLQASRLLWTGSDPVLWGSVNWNSVNWNSVNWNSVNWNSVNWNSVNWNNDYWEP